MNYQTSGYAKSKEAPITSTFVISPTSIPGKLPKQKLKCRPQKCKLCNKEQAQDLYFCNKCLTQPNRDLTFQKRIRIILDIYLRKMKGGLEK